MTMLQQMSIVRPSSAVALQPWTELERARGTRQKVLWQESDGASYAGLLALQPGARIARHRHLAGRHHVWVVDGSCTMTGHALYAGSYVFVPPGTEHETEAGPEGCTLFYLYLQTALG